VCAVVAVSSSVCVCAVRVLCAVWWCAVWWGGWCACCLLLPCPDLWFVVYFRLSAAACVGYDDIYKLYINYSVPSYYIQYKIGSICSSKNYLSNYLPIYLPIYLYVQPSRRSNERYLHTTVAAAAMIHLLI
jgi:hypothetical protein